MTLKEAALFEQPLTIKTRTTSEKRVLIM